MDIACFRWSCELVSGRAEVASTGAEDLVLGVVCVGGEGESASDSRQNGSLSRGKRGKTEKRRKFPINSKSLLVPPQQEDSLVFLILIATIGDSPHRI